MRAAIIVPPPGTPASTEMSNAFLRDVLSGASAEGRLLALPSGAVGAALARAVKADLADDGDTVLLVLGGGHRVLENAEAEEIGFDRAASEMSLRVDEEVESLMSRGFAATSTGNLIEARKCYLAADRRLGEEASPRRALVLVSLGDTARAEGNIEEATIWLDRALAIAPSHIGVLRERVALAVELGEHAVAAALLHRLVGSLETDAERAEILSTIASQSLAAAGDAIRRALVLHPGDHALLERLRAVHEARGEWADAVGVAVQLAEATESPDKRARALVEAARFCSRRTGNTSRSVALYEAAIEEDPQVPGAFVAIEQELLRAEDYRGVSAAYERQLERLRSTDAREEQCRLLRQLAGVEREHLNDAPAALSALQRLVALAPGDALSRVALAEILAFTEKHEEAVRELETAAELSPSRVETYRALYELFGSMRDSDRAYAACAALVALGEADIDEQMTYAQHSPSTVLATQRRFDADVWRTLVPSEHETELDRVAGALEGPAVDVWLGEHRDQAQARINERLRQHPRKTTVSAVRSAAWAADLLGVPEPAIYAQPDNDRISVATLPMREHAVLLGRHVLAGRSPPELSFIFVHHLSYSRPGWRILTFYPQMEELEPLVRAALALACPKLSSLRELDARGAALKVLLEPLLDAQARAQIGEAVERLLERQARLDLLAWARGVEATACRAALLACGDATVAATALAVSGMPAGGLSARDRALRVLPYAVSARYASLRKRLGVAVAQSGTPERTEP